MSRGAVIAAPVGCRAWSGVPSRRAGDGGLLRELLLSDVLPIVLPQLFGFARPSLQLLQPGPRLDLRHPDFLIGPSLPLAAGMDPLGDDPSETGYFPSRTSSMNGREKGPS
jgi:hypothetical protein